MKFEFNFDFSNPSHLKAFKRLKKKIRDEYSFCVTNYNYYTKRHLKDLDTDIDFKFHPFISEDLKKDLKLSGIMHCETPEHMLQDCKWLFDLEKNQRNLIYRVCPPNHFYNIYNRLMQVCAHALLFYKDKEEQQRWYFPYNYDVKGFSVTRCHFVAQALQEIGGETNEKLAALLYKKAAESNQSGGYFFQTALMLKTMGGEEFENLSNQLIEILNKRVAREETVYGHGEKWYYTFRSPDFYKYDRETCSAYLEFMMAQPLERCSNESVKMEIFDRFPVEFFGKCHSLHDRNSLDDIKISRTFYSQSELEEFERKAQKLELIKELEQTKEIEGE